jgi:hypothetical protein
MLRAYGIKVVLEKLEKNKEVVLPGGIIVPQESTDGFTLNKAKVLSIGSEVPAEEGLAVGDIVLYDKCSVFHDTHPIVVTNYENIICTWVEED